MPATGDRFDHAGWVDHSHRGQETWPIRSTIGSPSSILTQTTGSWGSRSGPEYRYRTH